MSDFSINHFIPPGPVATAFLEDPNFIRFLLGPQGSGKTTACIFDLIRNAGRMPPGIDGKKRFRCVVVRDTYRNLYNTTVKSWWDWYPKDVGEWRGGDDRPAEHILDFETPDGPLHFEIRFAALGDDKIENVLRGYEFTAAWMNEADLMTEDALTYLVGRVGRYPQQRLMGGKKFRRFIIGDLNAPDVDNWIYKRFVEDVPAGHVLYRQPSGRSGRAENLANLVDGYYDDQVKVNAHQPWWIRRYVDAEFGYSREGEPVYPEYNDQVHCAATPFGFAEGASIDIGMDAGLTPAAVFGNWLPNGQWRIPFELVPGRMGAARFGRAIKQFLAEHAPGARIRHVTADPSSFYGADKEGGEFTWVETVSEILEMPIEPAPTNELGFRLDAVREPLGYLIDGSTPGFVISPACRILRKGFNSHYRYRKIRMGQTERVQEVPDKNDFSHPHDALQYLISGAKGRYGVITQMRNEGAGQFGGRSHTLKAKFNPLGVGVGR